jgi:hypothetical protein
LGIRRDWEEEWEGRREGGRDAGWEEEPGGRGRKEMGKKNPNDPLSLPLSGWIPWHSCHKIHTHSQSFITD